MWNKKVVRLFGVLLAVILTAAACGSTTETSAADTTEAETPAESTDDAMEEDAMEEMEDTDHGDGDHDDHAGDDHGGDDHGEHDHSTGIEVDAALPIPAVEVELTETDTAGVFAIAVSLENFTITEDALDGDPVDNEGHMHLYLDGTRVERFFDLEHEITVPEGEHVIEVELSANNHSPYTIDDEPIRATATVTGAGDDSSGIAAADATATLTATLADGTVTVDGDDRLELSEGDVVMVMITSDTADEIHVHGYDIFADVAPGEDAMIVFTADIPGRFEIEFETSHQFIAELVIS